MEFILDDINNDSTSNFSPFIDVSSFVDIPRDDTKDTTAYIMIIFKIYDEEIFQGCSR